jgi:hypothetical protein
MVALFANGDVRFRMAWGQRPMNAADITSVMLRRAHGATSLVVRGRSLRGAAIPDTSQARELIRQLAAMNPEIKLPREL